MRYIAASALLAATAVSAADIAVTVGANSLLAFSPTSVTAAVGDVITFSFNPKNHTVTQSSFAAPCTKINETALDSGFVPTSSGVSPTTFKVTVNDTAPIWFYCKQSNPSSHCKAGMVFAVNPTADKTFDQFQSNAKSSSSGTNSTSGGGNSTTSGKSTSGSGGYGSGSATGSGSAASSTSSSGSKSNAAVAISGNVAGLLSFVGLVAGLVF